MASFWGYGENHEMEQLGQKLLCTTLELEKLKAEAMEEMRKNKLYIKQLIDLLKYAIQERDEARNQFQKLLNKTMPLTTTADSLPSIPLFQSDGHLSKPGKAANSGITESNSLSETHNPVDSLFDAVSSPEFPKFNFAVNQPVIQESNPVISDTRINPVIVPKTDQESLVIDNLAMGRVLPEKGKFLQAVLQSGPLLQTLLLAGPLPRWRNPPQFQAFQIPPVSTKGRESDVFSYNQPSNSQPYSQLTCGSAQFQTASMLNFANSGSGNCLSDALLMNTNGYGPLTKRQRFSWN